MNRLYTAAVYQLLTEQYIFIPGKIKKTEIWLK